MVRHRLSQSSSYLFPLVTHLKSEIARLRKVSNEELCVSIHCCKTYHHVVTVVVYQEETLGYIIERYQKNTEDVEVCIATVFDKEIREHKQDISEKFFEAVKARYLKGYSSNSSYFPLHQQLLAKKHVVFDSCDFADYLDYIMYDNQILACAIKKSEDSYVYIEMGRSLVPLKNDLLCCNNQKSRIAPFILSWT